MFRWLRGKSRSEDALDELRRRYAKLLEEARDLQRKGDIRGFADKTAEAEAVGIQLDAAEAAQKAAEKS
jgi:hypothetical protein